MRMERIEDLLRILLVRCSGTVLAGFADGHRAEQQGNTRGRHLGKLARVVLGVGAWLMGAGGSGPFISKEGCFSVVDSKMSIVILRELSSME
jgi:hypothetical protein